MKKGANLWMVQLGGFISVFNGASTNGRDDGDCCVFEKVLSNEIPNAKEMRV